MRGKSTRALTGSRLTAQFSVTTGSLPQRVLSRLLWRVGLVHWSPCRDVPVGTHGASMMMCDCHGRDQVAAKIMADGWRSFEKPLPSVLRQLTSIGPCVYFDVGANTGFYSLLAALSGALEVRAFEPLPSPVRILKRNLRLNAARLKVPVSVFPCALSDQKGMMSLFLPAQSHGLVETSASLSSGFKDEHSAVLRVRTTTLDEHLEECPVEEALQLIIKVDVEGGEGQVLAGAASTIHTRRPWLIVEILPRGDREFFEAFSREHDYNCYPLRPMTNLGEVHRIADESPSWNYLFFPAERNPVATLNFN